MRTIQSWKFSAAFFVALAIFFGAFGNFVLAAVMLLIAALFVCFKPGRAAGQR